MSGGGSVCAMTASSGTSAGFAPPVGTNPARRNGSTSVVRNAFWNARTGGKRLLQYGGWLTLPKSRRFVIGCGALLSARTGASAAGRISRASSV